ncbi:MAG TPA: hypothetical protein VFS00_26640, partial [Polyangiaceae bacterium]|nr:hypothetical protein [Polyangiaceae bacterium]
MKPDELPNDRAIGACVASLRAATLGLEHLSPVALSALARAAAGFVRAAKRLRRRRSAEGRRRDAGRSAALAGGVAP